MFKILIEIVVVHHLNPQISNSGAFNSLICCICSGGRCQLATCFSYKREGCTVSANSVAGLQQLTQFPALQAQRKLVTHLSFSSIFGHIAASEPQYRDEQ